MLRRVCVFAPAKINLALHVTGRRADGYHLLDTLVAFASLGDRVVLDLDTPPGLTLSGPESAGVPADGRNLVARTLAAFWPAAAPGITLEKNLPPASGIGGGSADAAATWRAMAALGGWPAPGPADMARLLALGADIPMCLASRPARVTGIGETIQPLPALAALPAILVNPRVEVPTPAVFAALGHKENPALAPLAADPTDRPALIDWLARQRNDLEAPAITLAPVIAQVLAALRALPGCRLARMSGSGATCFALMSDEAAAASATQWLEQEHPGWWVRAALIDAQDRSAPVAG
jgi:4-diphosphocytidyl-2-C-methyl-D-erythritol kinase